MNVCFINFGIHAFKKRSYPRHVLPPMDIGYAAAVLDKEGFNSYFIDLELEKKSPKRVLEFLEKVNISTLIIKSDIQVAKEALNFTKKIKQTRKVISIGPSLTLVPKAFINKESPVDVGVCYEPEYVLKNLLKKIKKESDYSKLKGIAYFDKKLTINQREKPVSSLDNFPFPKHSLFLNKKYSFFYPTSLKKRQKIGFILASRGCPYSCAFCSPIKRNSYGKIYRQRSVKNIVAEIKFLKSNGVNMIYFRDDLFNLKKGFVYGLCREISRQKLDISWAAQCRADLLDYEQAKIMKKSGCVCINTGIESISDRTLKKINKGTTIKRIEEGIIAAKKAGINVVGCFILGLPEDTINEMKNSVEFSKKVGLDMFEMLLFTKYPKTACNIYNNFSSYEYGTPEKMLARLHKSLHKQFYLRPGYIFNYIRRNFVNLVSNPPLLGQTLAFLSGN